MRSTSENIEILFEDNHLIIVNKRSGDLAQGDKTNDTPLNEIVKQYIKKKYNKPGNVYLGVTHRIDRPTSGVLIFAKTSKALERMNVLFRTKEIEKTYWAVTKNCPEQLEGRLENYLKKNSKNNKSSHFKKQTKDSKYAILEYCVIKKLDNYYLLKVNLETGRHHQIRCQLSSIGCPIKGDLKYGAKRSNKDGSIHLHSREVCFIHPTTKAKMKIIAPTPNDPIWNNC